MPTNPKFENIPEFRILPRNKEFYREFVYKVKIVQADVNFDKTPSIDHGIDNWLTCVSNVGTNLIVDGKYFKFLNQWYNTQIANITEGKSQRFWCNLLANITDKRNGQIRDAVNKAARIVIDHSLENRIGGVSRGALTTPFRFRLPQFSTAVQFNF